MFDCHNAIDETEPHATLVERHYDLIRHIHANELDGRHPGTGSYEFKAVFDVLRRHQYDRWISLEAFDFTPGAETIARDSLALSGNSMSKYVVTGGAGFIGSAIVRGLLREGARQVIVLDNLLTGHERNLDEVRSAIDLQRADIRSYDQIAPILAWRRHRLSRSRYPVGAPLHRRPCPVARNQYRWHVQRAARGCGGRRPARRLCRVVIGVWRHRSVAQSRNHGAAAQVALCTAKTGRRILR